MTSSKENNATTQSISDPPKHTAEPQEDKESVDSIDAVNSQPASVNEKDVSRVPVEPETEKSQPVIDTEDYTVFTVNQRRMIIVVGSFAAWFSPMTGSIYTPAIDKIGHILNVSTTQINLTVTTYLIFQGISPMMIAGFADSAGRRPAYIICFTIYTIANLALGLQNSYVALLILRMVQAAGSSGTVALANGVVGDLITSSERGQYVAFASLGSILGPTLSPIIGGLLSQYLDWHWIFWFLLILGGVFAVPMFIFLPETCRKIVGDHSVPPPWTSANVTDYIRFANRARKGIVVDEEKMNRLRQNYKLTIPNPLSTLKILADPESAMILFAAGLALACFYALQTALSEVFTTQYGFNQIQNALMFLPIGAGALVSAFTTGKLIDWNYRRHAKRLNFPLVKNRQTDLSTFPVELARMQICLPLLIVGAIAVVAYGWILTHRVSLAAPIIMLFIFGYTLIAGSQALNVLMVDLWPTQPAAATAASNVTRCLLGAAASAAIGPMNQAMGYGWSYTVLAALFLVSSIGPLASMRYGMSWRALKKKRQEARKAKRAALA